MTWSPRNRSEDGDDIDNDNDDDLESSKENANITNTSHDSALNVSPRTRDGKNLLLVLLTLVISNTDNSKYHLLSNYINK